MGYSTAMDIYVILCFVSVFAALVEFACINFIDTFIKREAKDKESNPTLLQVERLSRAKKSIEGWPLSTVETEANGNSWSTHDRAT